MELLPHGQLFDFSDFKAILSLDAGDGVHVLDWLDWLLRTTSDRIGSVEGHLQTNRRWKEEDK